MLVHDAIFGASLVNLFFGSVLLSGADLSAVSEPDQLLALGMLVPNGFDYGFHMGLFLFSLHLGILGYLAYKSGYAPKILGVLLVAAFLSYLIDSIAVLFLPIYPAIIDQVLMVPEFIGELAIVVWLAFRGGKGATDG